MIRSSRKFALACIVVSKGTPLVAPKSPRKMRWAFSPLMDILSETSASAVIHSECWLRRERVREADFPVLTSLTVRFKPPASIRISRFHVSRSRVPAASGHLESTSTRLAAVSQTWQGRYPSGFQSDRGVEHLLPKSPTSTRTSSSARNDRCNALTPQFCLGRAPATTARTASIAVYQN